jgi:hypothetical protein
VELLNGAITKFFAPADRAGGSGAGLAKAWVRARTVGIEPAQAKAGEAEPAGKWPALGPDAKSACTGFAGAVEDQRRPLRVQPCDAAPAKNLRRDDPIPVSDDLELHADTPQPRHETLRGQVEFCRVAALRQHEHGTAEQELVWRCERRFVLQGRPDVHRGVERFGQQDLGAGQAGREIADGRKR